MDIQPADRRVRKGAVVAFAIALALGAWGIAAFEGWLDGLRHLPSADAHQALRRAFVLASAGATAVSLLLGLFVWRFGARIRRDLRFPPLDARVIRDTMILHGDAARRRGHVIQGLGALLVLCALALLVMSWLLYASVFARAT